MSEVGSAEPDRPASAVVSAARTPSWWWALPVVAAVAYAVLLAIRLRGIVDAVYANSDAAISPLIADAMRHAPGGHTIWMTTNTFVNAIWFDRVTAALPFARALWVATPPVLALLAAVLVGWTVHRVTGGRRPSAVAAGVLAGCAPPPALYGLLPQEFHGSTAVNTVLLAAFLAAATTAGPVLRPRLPVLAVAVGLVTGLDLASDPLLYVTGAVPLVVAVVVVVVARPAAEVAGLLRTAAVAVVAGAVGLAATAAGAAASGIVTLPAEGTGGELASPSRAAANLKLLGANLARLGDGRLFGGGAEARSVEAWLAGIAVLAAVALPLALLVRERRRGPADGASGPTAARVAHLAFWGTSAPLLLVAYAGSTFATDLTTVRYLSVLVFAVASVVPLAAGLGRRASAVAAALAAGWVAASALGLATVPAVAYRDGGNGGNAAVSPDLDALVRVLTDHGLRRGYAGYWDAHALTWRSELRLEVRPVMEGRPCGDPGGRRLCAYHFNTADGWYVPQPVARSFVILHAGAACMFGPPDVGAPEESIRVGATDVLVYSGDVAARLVPSSFRLCPPGERDAVAP